MALSMRFIFWIPVTILFTLNLAFKLWIFILQNVGNASVWVNRQLIRAGDWCTDKAKKDEQLDNLIDTIRQARRKAERDKRK